MEGKQNRHETQISITEVKGQEAFDRFEAFVKRLREEYSLENFPGEMTAGTEGGNKELVGYEAQAGAKTTGFIIGDREGDTLHGHWFIIDPKYQQGETKKKLLEIMDENFSRIEILASTVETPEISEGNLDLENEFLQKLTSRQQALVRYYNWLGFEHDKDSPLNKLHREPHDPLPMVREKKKKKP